MIHEFLMATSANLPMKTIQINGQDYLQRYYCGQTDDGGQLWLHRFLRADAERHLHTHPWEGKAFVLSGSYKEQLHTDHGDRFRYFSVGWMNHIYPSTLHRIVEVEPNTWTLLHIKAGRLPTWKFISDDGSEVVMQSSPEDWHKDFKVRDA